MNIFWNIFVGRLNTRGKCNMMNAENNRSRFYDVTVNPKINV